MMRENGRKGQAYSVIVLLIIIPILIFILGFLSSSQDITTNRLELIVSDQMSQVAKNIEDDFSRAVQTAGRRALLAEVNRILLTGQPIDNATFRMEELMLNGSLYGNVSVIMFNNTVRDWRQKILSTPIGFERNISYYSIHIENLDGFHILVSFSLDINLSHKLSASKIQKSLLKNTSVSVIGLEDPLYVLNSAGNVQKQIMRYPYSSAALKILTGSRAGNCTGTATFQAGGGAGKILVAFNASGQGGVDGVVAEAPDLPPVSCYSLGNANATSVVNNSIQQQNFSTIYLDQMTGVWILPLSGGLQYYNVFSSSGPDYLKRLEGRLDSSVNGLESFVMDATGIPVKPGQSRIDYKYFSNSTITGSRVRGFPQWVSIYSSIAGNYNVTELLGG